MTEPPTGEVTFLFTDIEGSTLLWDQWPDIMEAALAEHDQRVRAVVDAWSGYVFTTAGDSFSIAFGSPTDAVSAAIAMQLAMREPALGLDLRIRMGLHTGSASIRDGDYFGGALNRCARLTSTAHGGQILLSGSTMELVASALPDGVELVDMGVHRLRDLAEPERIHQLNHPELESSFPKLRSLEGPGDTLPGQLTSFVGREREIGDVEALLGEHRLVTLSGSGGAGKTRLALEVAEHLVRSFPDGLRFAELASLFDKDVFENEVAERFGATAVADVPLATTIAEAIGERRMLMILDNCEQIVDHVAALSRDLLIACPNFHIIATSRERLAIAGEVVYRVPSLSLPPADVDPATSLEFDAIRLFVDRAQLVDPVFELGPTNVDDVIAICRRLDGIPLALELAAARVRSMSPAQISIRLDERFRILTASERSGSQRQQTLLRTIEWSHDLLDERERMAFRRLGTFVSDFSLEAAEQVAADGQIDEFDVLELITGLVDKSMVTTESGAATRPGTSCSRASASSRSSNSMTHRNVTRRIGGMPTTTQISQSPCRPCTAGVSWPQHSCASTNRRTTFVPPCGSRWMPPNGNRRPVSSARWAICGTSQERTARASSGVGNCSTPTPIFQTWSAPVPCTATRASSGSRDVRTWASRQTVSRSHCAVDSVTRCVWVPLSTTSAISCPTSVTTPAPSRCSWRRSRSTGPVAPMRRSS